MICKPCGKQKHTKCTDPITCPCQHRPKGSHAKPK